MPGNNVNWPTPLTRLNPFYPGQMGVPGTWSETGLRLNTEGAIFYVDPNHPDPNDQRDGTDPTSPLATIDAAVAKCEAYRGDVICVMHNGFWTYANASSANITPIQETVTLDVPGVRLIGVSSSTLGVPWVGSANNDVLITITAMDCIVEGFCFWEGTYTGVTAIYAAWDGPPYGENLTVRHNYFFGMDYGVVMDYTYNCFVEDNYFFGMGVAAIYNPGVYGDPDYLVVRDNIFVSNVADIDLADTDDVLVEGNRFLDVTAAITMDGGDYNTIVKNTIQGDGTGTNNFINLTGGADNLVCQNCLACTIAQYDTTCSDATSGSWGGNNCSNGVTTAAPT